MPTNPDHGPECTGDHQHWHNMCPDAKERKRTQDRIARAKYEGSLHGILMRHSPQRLGRNRQTIEEVLNV